jgi:hypothetical protein
MTAAACSSLQFVAARRFSASGRDKRERVAVLKTTPSVGADDSFVWWSATIRGPVFGLGRDQINSFRRRVAAMRARMYSPRRRFVNDPKAATTWFGTRGHAAGRGC